VTRAKVFRSKNCRGIRLPRQMQVYGGELDSFRRGDEIISRDKQGTTRHAFQLLASPPNDLTIADRQIDRPQKRNARRKKRGRG
jgi:virulence-associated protein VagC